MKNIFEIIQSIKDIKGLKTDEEVAAVLDMAGNALFNHKGRNTVPVKAILTFCDKERFSADAIFFGVPDASDPLTREILNGLRDLSEENKRKVLEFAKDRALLEKLEGLLK